MDTNSLSIEKFKGPKYRRLYDALDRAIRSGMLRPGARLPPVRELAWQLKITPGTVARAYQLATDDGLLEATVGRGTFVRSAERSLADMPANDIASLDNDQHLNFRNGHIIDVGQSALMADILREIAGSDSFDLGRYAQTSELHSCQQAATDWLIGRGINARSSDLILTHGGHNAVMVALISILHGRDPVIVTSNLVYPGFRQSARICRASLIGVDSDADGICPDQLEAVCRKHRPQALLVSSNVHNPTCVQTPTHRREAIAALARKYDFQIIEDDVYGTLIENPPTGYDVMCPDRTWYATSLSKCFAAGVRIGFLQCPPGKGELGTRVMQGMSLSISHLLTRMTEQLLNSGAIVDFARRLASENTARVEIARQILANWDVQSRYGVNLIWIRKPDRWTSGAFLTMCERRGVMVAPGDNFTLPGDRAPNSVRLTLSGAPDFPALHAGLKTVDAVLRSGPQGMLT